MLAKRLHKRIECAATGNESLSLIHTHTHKHILLIHVHIPCHVEKEKALASSHFPPSYDYDVCVFPTFFFCLLFVFFLSVSASFCRHSNRLALCWWIINYQSWNTLILCVQFVVNNNLFENIVYLLVPLYAYLFMFVWFNFSAVWLVRVMHTNELLMKYSQFFLNSSCSFIFRRRKSYSYKPSVFECDTEPFKLIWAPFKEMI